MAQFEDRNGVTNFQDRNAVVLWVDRVGIFLGDFVATMLVHFRYVKAP